MHGTSICRWPRRSRYHLVGVIWVGVMVGELKLYGFQPAKLEKLYGFQPAKLETGEVIWVSTSKTEVIWVLTVLTKKNGDIR